MQMTVSRALGRVSLGGYRLVQRARNKSFSLLVGGGFAAFGRRTVIELPVRISGEGRISIGSDVFLGSGCWLRVDPDGEGVALEIGEGTSVAGSCVFSAEQSVRIGSHVLFARNVYVADHMHAFEGAGEPVLEQGVTRVAPVEIGDGAWLGQNVVVGPGVRIGRGAVVGSNSVVLTDVPDYSVVVGAPAKLVRTFAPEENARARQAGV
jgi:acetyltransferase-like isoleucine patch superfamily enzyme